MYVVLLVAVTGLMGAVTVGEMFKGTLELESGTGPPLVGPGVLASGAFAMAGIDEGMVDGENSDGGAAVVARPRDE